MMVKIIIVVVCIKELDNLFGLQPFSLFTIPCLYLVNEVFLKPHDSSDISFVFLELDFDFVKGLTSQVQGMRTKRFWQPALRKLFSFRSSDDRQAVLQFLLETMKKFQVGICE